MHKTMNAEKHRPSRGKIHVLLLESKEADAELLLGELRRYGYDPVSHRVATLADFADQISSDLDVILADFRLPDLDGLEAMRQLRQKNLDIPFIIISGAFGEEFAARCIKEGVADFLLKDRPGRLGMAVESSLEEKRLRSERKQLDEQLRQAQKMELLGQLAGGIAHDFNNVLTVINGWSALLLEEKVLPKGVREAVMHVYTAGVRAVGLSRQLLFFSSSRAIDRRPLDINAIVEEVSIMLRRLIGENITLELALAPQALCALADAGMIEQVLINLAVNGRDAMPRGGRLLVSTRLAHLRERDVQGRPQRRSGQFVCIHVKDTGCGISPEVLPRIFEPFFTTKGPGKGTGLGLATTFGIMKQHMGWIEVESRMGAGSTFSLFLPAMAPEAVAAATPKGEEIAANGGRETILVVEDETLVREFAVAVLRPYGYRVLEAHSGVDALEVWRLHSARIDLLLTDMVMPDDMTGVELAARLVAEKPSIRVIFTSGYNPEGTANPFGHGKNSRFIHKPYSPRDLALVVRDVLDSRESNEALSPSSRN
jgi:two-component system, cell cycle sensor histidine kinase and response regulator CckA